MKPIARATAREINETIRYTCWAVFARGDQPGEGAEARLVKMHSARRQTSEASEGLASFAEKRAANG